MQNIQTSKILGKILYMILGIAIGLFLTPLKSVLGIFERELVSRLSPNLILQLWGMTTFLLFVIIALLILWTYNLRNKFNYKRLFRFGIYWYKTKARCPECGSEMIDTAFDYMGCNKCNQKIKLYDIEKARFITFKEASEIIKKEA